jgi:RNA polymerase sigma factor (sigma-70 family)
MELVWVPMQVVGREAPCPSVPDDAALMARFATGDTSAFEQLYRRHRAPLYRYIVRLTPHRVDADEVFQEVWMAVVRSCERYQPSARFVTFLFAIAHRRIADQARRAGRFSKVQISESVVDQGAGPQILAEGAALAMAVQAAVGQLPLVQRETFLLHAEGDLTVQEIADVTGAPYETVKSRLKYANQTLREKLKAWK